MTVLMSPLSVDARVRPATRVGEGMPMLLHEALARSRQQEAEEAARRYRLVRAAQRARGVRCRRLLAVLAVPFRRSARARAAAARRAAYTSGPIVGACGRSRAHPGWDTDPPALAARGRSTRGAG
jgi:hypothetical protein